MASFNMQLILILHCYPPWARVNILVLQISRCLKLTAIENLSAPRPVHGSLGSFLKLLCYSFKAVLEIILL